MIVSSTVGRNSRIAFEMRYFSQVRASSALNKASYSDIPHIFFCYNILDVKDPGHFAKSAGGRFTAKHAYT